MREGGYFISFEGIDRSGKSTQAALLAEQLGARAMLVREPGGTEYAEIVRKMLKDPDLAIGPRAEALLFASARADLVSRVIRPALADGMVVIADRFIDSSLAYQGAARGLGVEQIDHLNNWAADGLLPDTTVLIEVDVATAHARGREPDDRFENEGAGLQEAVAAAYAKLAQRAPDRFICIDGDRDEAVISQEVCEIALERIRLSHG